MNLYVVVEGRRTERRLLRRWLPYLVPEAREIQRVEDADGKTFYLVSGEGYPNYVRVVGDAARDCARSPQAFHLVVCVDAEEVPVDIRAEQIREAVVAALDAESSAVPYTVVVANCCIESWLLGNRRLVRRHPEDAELVAYRAHYDVVAEDPELMPQREGDRNRAATHLQYLKAAFRERGMKYTKAHPGDAGERHYFDALVERATQTQPDGTRHLRTLAGLLAVGQPLGGPASTAASEG